MNRTIFPFIFVLLFSSCILSKYEMNVNVVDYSKICNGNNFFMTESNSVSFEYKALGSISVNCVSGQVLTEQEQQEREWGTFGGPTGTYKTASIEDAYKEIVRVAKEHGANGVINLQSRYVGEYSTKYSNYPSRWIVTGMMIIK
jgi:uncharacterized protein YbjQ (UPF0145 family)